MVWSEALANTTNTLHERTKKVSTAVGEGQAVKGEGQAGSAKKTKLIRFLGQFSGHPKRLHLHSIPGERNNALYA